MLTLLGLYLYWQRRVPELSWARSGHGPAATGKPPLATARRSVLRAPFDIQPRVQIVATDLLREAQRYIGRGKFTRFAGARCRDGFNVKLISSNSVSVGFDGFGDVAGIARRRS